MAYDKVVDSAVLEQGLTEVADAIRAKNGTTEPLDFPEGYVEAVEPLVNKEEYLTTILNRTVDEIVSTEAIYGSYQEGNKNLKKYDLPLITSISSNVLKNCSSLVSVNLPSVTTMTSGNFIGCSSLISVNLSSLTKMNANNFETCNSLERLYLPSLETITGWGWNFSNNNKLKYVYLPKLTNLTSSDFTNTKALTTLILGADTICTLASTNVFSGTCAIAKGTGYVYVPKALVEEYKVATNWSTYANQIRAIEDYPEVLEGWE